MSVWLAREQVLSEGDPFREILETLNNDGDAKDNAWKKIYILPSNFADAYICSGPLFATELAQA